MEDKERRTKIETETEEDIPEKKEEDDQTRKLIQIEHGEGFYTANVFEDEPFCMNDAKKQEKETN